MVGVVEVVVGLGGEVELFDCLLLLCFGVVVELCWGEVVE